MHGGIEFADVKAFANLDSDFLYLRDDRLVGDMRRMKLEQVRCIGEIYASRHRIDLDFWRRLHIDAWVRLEFDRLGCLSEFGKQRDLIASLNLVNRIIVRRAVRLGAADDPDIRR